MIARSRSATPSLYLTKGQRLLVKGLVDRPNVCTHSKVSVTDVDFFSVAIASLGWQHLLFTQQKDKDYW